MVHAILLLAVLLTIGPAAGVQTLYRRLEELAATPPGSSSTNPALDLTVTPLNVPSYDSQGKYEEVYGEPYPKGLMEPYRRPKTPLLTDSTEAPTTDAEGYTFPPDSSTEAPSSAAAATADSTEAPTSVPSEADHTAEVPAELPSDAPTAAPSSGTISTSGSRMSFWVTFFIVALAVGLLVCFVAYCRRPSMQRDYVPISDLPTISTTAVRQH